MEQQEFAFDSDVKDWFTMSKEEKAELYKEFLTFNIVALGAQSHYFMEKKGIANVLPSDFATDFLSFVNSAIDKANAVVSESGVKAEDTCSKREKSIDNFVEYLKEVHALYKDKGRLKGQSYIATKYGVMKISIQQFFEFKCHEQEEITREFALDVRRKIVNYYK